MTKVLLENKSERTLYITIQINALQSTGKNHPLWSYNVYHNSYSQSLPTVYNIPND